MTIEYKLKRKDLRAASLALVLRRRSTYVWNGLLGVGMFFLLYNMKPLDGSRVSVGTALIGAVLVVLFTVIVLLVSVWINVGRVASDGVLGVHSITLGEEGLREETELNSTLHRWPGISAPTSTRRLVIVPIAPGLLHVIPRNAFSSEMAEQEFVAEIQRRRSMGSRVYSDSEKS